jgi:hypothetical protein
VREPVVCPELVREPEISVDIETRIWWYDGWLEFRWPVMHLMFGFDLRDWMVGVQCRFGEPAYWCISIHLLCFDAHIQYWGAERRGDKHD